MVFGIERGECSCAMLHVHQRKRKSPMEEIRANKDTRDRRAQMGAQQNQREQKYTLQSVKGSSTVTVLTTEKRKL